ncbi:hypothetical protein FEM33_15535 [Dyadobacter flavalbus]|uniref:Uncharacterized protein n=1 Tax=Dyadobacter flavalbus TaxID=2579942 RepID=A0A5M8QUU4_9BACT|nr:hypothetical protein [Dyadobacter flavalbus]KAA6438830.1 hypothetical protein FEM33_15535 [Dyadobacter flavalbus]
MKLKNKYRVVEDEFNGFEAQVKYWFYPFQWFEINGNNSSRSLERAKKIIEAHKQKVHYKE